MIVQGEDREYFHLFRMTFDVTEALQRIEQEDLSPQPFHIKEIGNLLGLIRVDEEHLEKVDIDKPGILCYVQDLEGYLLIDGWHRLARRRKEGLTTMDCYLVDYPEIIVR
ncbi:MAG: hypothetical protein ACWGQW_01975 [bacterium]